MAEDEIKTPDLRNAKLVKEDLTSRDLRGADLTGAVLSKARLAGMDLSGVKLFKANLQDAELDSARLTGAELREAKVRGDWTKVEASKADCSGILGQKWALLDCRFNETSFTKSSVRRLVVRGSTFDNCDFTKLTAPDAVMADCTFRNCRFDQADLSCPKMTGCVFENCRLADTDLSGPVIEKTMFKQCDLTKADFIAGEFKELELNASTVARANFRYARGLTPEQKEAIGAGGGKISKKRLIATLKALAGTRRGRIGSLVLLVIVAVLIILHLAQPENWSDQKLKKNIDECYQKMMINQELEDIPERAIAYFRVLIDRRIEEEKYGEALTQRLAMAEFLFRYLEVMRNRMMNVVLSEEQSQAVDLAFNSMIQIFEEIENLPDLDESMRVSYAVEKLKNMVLKLEMLAIQKRDEAYANIEEEFFTNLNRHLEKASGFHKAFELFELIGNSYILKPATYEKSVAIVTRLEQDARQANFWRRWLPFPALLARQDSDSPISDVDFLYLEARLLDKLGKQQEALAKLKELENTPGAPDDKVRRGMMFMADLQRSLGLGNEVLATFERIRRRYPDAINDICMSQVSEASYLQGAGRFQEATNAFQRIIDEGLCNTAQMIMAKSGITSIFMAQGRLEQAEAVAREVTESLEPSDPSYITAISQLSEIYLQQNRNEDARKLLEEVVRISIDPNFVNQARRKLVQVHWQNQEKEQAIELMETLLENATDPNVKITDLVNYAEMQAAMDRLDLAAAALEEALGLAGNDQKLMLVQNYAGILNRTGKHEQLHEFLEKLISENPPTTPLHLWARFELVIIARRDHHDQEANDLLREILRTDFQESVLPPNFLNATYAEDPEGRALVGELLEKILAAQPASTYAGSNARLLLANRLLEEKTQPSAEEKERAVGFAREVIRENRDPNMMSQGYQFLAQLARRDGDKQQALQWYREMEKQHLNDRMANTAVFEQGQLLLELGEEKEGLGKMEAAYTACVDPNDCCRIAFQYGNRLAENGDRDHAREVFEYIRDQLPECWSRDEAIVMLEALD